MQGEDCKTRLPSVLCGVELYFGNQLARVPACTEYWHRPGLFDRFCGFPIFAGDSGAPPATLRTSSPVLGVQGPEIERSARSRTDSGPNTGESQAINLASHPETTVGVLGQPLAAQLGSTLGFQAVEIGLRLVLFRQLAYPYSLLGCRFSRCNFPATEFHAEPMIHGPSRSSGVQEYIMPAPWHNIFFLSFIHEHNLYPNAFD